MGLLNMKNVKFKRVLFLFFVTTFLILGLCSCDSSNLSQKNSSQSNSINNKTISKNNESLLIAPATFDGMKFGIIDISGNWIVEPSSEFEMIENFSEGLAWALHKNGYYGCINTSGDWVIEPNYKFEFNNDQKDFSNGLACVYGENGLYGYINKKGETIVPPIYDWSMKFKDGYASYLSRPESRTTNELIDTSGKVVYKKVELDCSANPTTFSEGLLSIDNDKGKFGYVNANGEWIIPAKFDRAFHFSEGLAYVSLNNKNFFIDKTGKTVFELGKNESIEFKDEYATVWDYKTGKAGLVDKTGALIIPYKYDDISPLYNGIAYFSIDGKWGFIDKNNQILIKPQFEYANKSYFNEETNELYFNVSLNYDWGVLDSNLNWVIEPSFAYIQQFTEE